MRGYDREEVEDYDDYDMEGEYQDKDVEDEEGEEYEEEEARQPTKEEMEYLELRQRLKDSIKRKRKQSAAALSSQEKRLPYNNFGSFFGPSQPVIAQRVIQESKSLLENQNLVSKMLSSNQSSKKNSASNSAGPKLGQRGQAPKATSEHRKKAEKLKVARDYSFLSDNAEVPAPAKEPPPRNVSVPTSEARSAQMPPKSKQSLGSNSGRNIQGIREERKPVPLNGQMHKAGSYKSSSASKPYMISIDSRRQVGVNNGIGPGRPVSVNGIGPGRPVGVSNGIKSGRPVGYSNGIEPVRPPGPKGVPSKVAIAKMERRISAPAARNLPPSAHKSHSSKMHLSGSKQQFELKKGSQECSKDKIMPQRPVISSKPQVKKPVGQVSSHSHSTSNVLRPKKKQLSEDEKALMMIRNMFHTDRYPVCDDDDDSDMEANWEEIMKEERRSAKIARKEDEEQLRLIEEEERRERMRRMAKKRKISQH
ncbi:protein SPT2 homolog [Durio zibethinus]|uniref:Protein SPT2 homolog n=1 Tax=Durio zibethinus TaxID=66656 RepID=A0A6P6BDA3_DURZI|nr:protein SPT2 homolog [Durio zibethinus]